MPLFIDNIIVIMTVQIEKSREISKISWKYFLEWKLMGKSSDKWVQNMFTSQISNDSYCMSHTHEYESYCMTHTCESYFEFWKAQKVRKVHWSPYQGKWWKFRCQWLTIWYDSYHMSHGPWLTDHESSVWKLIEMKQQNERNGLGLAASPSGETECKMDSLRSIVKGLFRFRHACGRFSDFDISCASTGGF